MSQNNSPVFEFGPFRLDPSKRIWALPIDGGKPRQLTDFTFGQIHNFGLSRDGKPTLFSRGETRMDVVLITGFK